MCPRCWSSSGDLLEQGRLVVARSVDRPADAVCLHGRRLAGQQRAGGVNEPRILLPVLQAQRAVILACMGVSSGRDGGCIVLRFPRLQCRGFCRAKSQLSPRGNATLSVSSTYRAPLQSQGRQVVERSPQRLSAHNSPIRTVPDVKVLPSPLAPLLHGSGKGQRLGSLRSVDQTPQGDRCRRKVWRWCR